LSIDGNNLSPIECSVHLSLHQSADTFYAKIPLDNDAGLDEVFWLGTAPIPITILGTNDQSTGDFATMLVGQVDTPQVDFAMRTVSFRGRDLTGALTDLATSKQWQNLSNQQIITELATSVGLTVNFAGTTDNAGLQFDQDYTEFADNDACWNVIVSCAKRLGCIAFIKGTVLYIQPLDQPASSFYKVRYRRPTDEQIASGDFVTLTCSRNLHLAKVAGITMQSVRHKQGDTLTSKFQSKGKHTGSDKMLYQFRAANLTKEQQDRIAKSHLKETLSHERTINLGNLPGDVRVTPLSGIDLSGTGTDADQQYILSSAAHHWSENGYLMDLDGHSQDDSRGEPEQVS
jgi:phage protein D